MIRLAQEVVTSTITLESFSMYYELRLRCVSGGRAGHRSQNICLCQSMVVSHGLEQTFQLHHVQDNDTENRIVPKSSRVCGHANHRCDVIFAIL